MKSVKRGRGPSFLGGIVGVMMGIVGIAWTVGASSLGAPGFFMLFGICFSLIALGSAIYNFVNAAAKNRFSELDITSGDEEPDPLNQYFGERAPEPARRAPDAQSPAYCPYCGAAAGADYQYCRKCGKPLSPNNTP